MTTTSTTKKPTTRKYPAPLYAAAGAGELAYQKLRTLPAKVAELQKREIELDRFRTLARRNAAAFVAGAQAAQERAVAIYTDLVTRGEHLVEGGTRGAEAKVVEIADKAAANAATDAATTAKATKPAKQTRPAASK